MGYPVVRALDHYHRNSLDLVLSRKRPKLSKKDKLIEPTQYNLKVSVATNSNKSWSETFDLTNEIIQNDDGRFLSGSETWLIGIFSTNYIQLFFFCFKRNITNYHSSRKSLIQRAIDVA